MSADEKRVQFRTPSRLIDRTDSLAEVLGSDRTDVLVDALCRFLRDAARDDEITFEQLKLLVGGEEAANFRVLKRQSDGHLTEELTDR